VVSEEVRLEGGTSISPKVRSEGKERVRRVGLRYTTKADDPGKPRHITEKIWGMLVHRKREKRSSDRMEQRTSR